MALREPCEFTRSPTIVGAGSCTSGVAAIIDERCGARGAGRGATDRRLGDRPLDDRRDVRGGGAAAAAHDADAVALDELLQRLGQRLGLLGEDRLAVGSLQRQAGVGDARDRHRAVLAEEADRVAHVLGPGRAVQADHVDVAEPRAW